MCLPGALGGIFKLGQPATYLILGLAQRSEASVWCQGVIAKMGVVLVAQFLELGVGASIVSPRLRSFESRTTLQSRYCLGVVVC